MRKEQGSLTNDDVSVFALTSTISLSSTVAGVPSIVLGDSCSDGTPISLWSSHPPLAIIAGGGENGGSWGGSTQGRHPNPSSFSSPCDADSGGDGSNSSSGLLLNGVSQASKGMSTELISSIASLLPLLLLLLLPKASTVVAVVVEDGEGSSMSEVVEN